MCSVSLDSKHGRKLLCGKAAADMDLSRFWDSPFHIAMKVTDIFPGKYNEEHHRKNVNKTVTK